MILGVMAKQTEQRILLKDGAAEGLAIAVNTLRCFSTAEANEDTICVWHNPGVGFQIGFFDPNLEYEQFAHSVVTYKRVEWSDYEDPIVYFEMGDIDEDFDAEAAKELQKIIIIPRSWR